MHWTDARFSLRHDPYVPGCIVTSLAFLVIGLFATPAWRERAAPHHSAVIKLHPAITASFVT